MAAESTNSTALYTTLEVVVAVVAAVGNLAVVVCFSFERRLRRLTNYYILSLAASDFLVGLFGIPSAILTKLGIPENAPKLCLAMLSFLVVLCTVSILNLVAVSVDRYWAILYPLAYQRLACGRIVFGVIVTCWILGSLIGFLPLFGWHKEQRSSSCLFMEVVPDEFLAFLYFATIVYPAALIAFFYVRIYLVVLKQLRQISVFEQSSSTQASVDRDNRPSSSQQLNNDCSKHSTLNSRDSHVQRPQIASRREVKTAKNLFLIVIFFMICWIPLYTLNCVKAFCASCQAPVWVYDFFIILSHFNSAVNPFLYAYQMKDFRLALRKLLFCCCTRPSEPTANFEIPNSRYKTQATVVNNNVNHNIDR